MRRLLVLVLLVPITLAAKDHAWQQGVWRDVHLANAGALVVPVRGITIAAPLHLTFITIDGADGIRYVAKGDPIDAINNDPVSFAVEGKRLLVQQGKKARTFVLITRTRLPPEPA